MIVKIISTFPPFYYFTRKNEKKQETYNIQRIQEVSLSVKFVSSILDI